MHKNISMPWISSEAVFWLLHISTAGKACMVNGPIFHDIYALLSLHLFQNIPETWCWKRLTIQTPCSLHIQVSATFLTQTDAEASFNSPRNTLVFVCAAQGITHNPAVSQTNAYIKAEKLKQITVHFQYLQLLLWSTKINISATGSFLHPIAGSCTTLSHKSTDRRAREKQPGHIWFDLTLTD